jgi:hypothetical protein
LSTTEAPIKPLALIDVDGVLNVLGKASEANGFERHHIGEFTVRLNPIHGEWFEELAEHFDFAWATMWTHAANTQISPRLGLPEWPVIDHNDFERTANWAHGRKLGITDGFEKGGIDALKLKTIPAYVGETRPVVWVDDDISWAADEWVAERPGPTLLVKPNFLKGLQRHHVDEMIEWAKSL